MMKLQAKLFPQLREATEQLLRHLRGRQACIRQKRSRHRKEFSAAGYNRVAAEILIPAANF